MKIDKIPTVKTTILQKNALQRKLEKIMSRSGIKSRTEDVEHCLSLCVEVRLHGLISKLIKISKKKRSLMLSTAEVQHCVVISNQELWKEKIMQDIEFRGEIAANVGMNKDIKCAEPSQENKMKRTADETLRSANRAARAAAGWDDITSKWKFIDKPEWKKQEASSRSSIHQESPRKGTVKGLEHKISIKDIIALMERETLLSKSTLNYRLCNR